MNCPFCNAVKEDDAGVCLNCGAVVFRQGELVASRYEILTPLGGGGRCVVYQAYDRALQETVALQLLRVGPEEWPHRAARFLSDVKLARKVAHPNVCRIYEYGEGPAFRYLSLEFVEGVDLRCRMREKGPLSVEEAFDVAIQVAEGLHAIHQAGLIHRNLKTQSIIRDPTGAVKIMDCGLAKRLEADSASGGAAPGEVVGTPEYMSPEQGRGETEDARSDIYALGVVIFELLTGEVPFQGPTAETTLLKHMWEEPPLSAQPEIPAPLAAVLAKALAKAPDERYASAAELADALRQARSLGDGHSGAFTDPWVFRAAVTWTEATEPPAPSVVEMLLGRRPRRTWLFSTGGRVKSLGWRALAALALGTLVLLEVLLPKGQSGRLRDEGGSAPLYVPARQEAAPRPTPPRPDTATSAGRTPLAAANETAKPSVRLTRPPRLPSLMTPAPAASERALMPLPVRPLSLEATAAAGSERADPAAARAHGLAAPTPTAENAAASEERSAGAGVAAEQSGFLQIGVTPWAEVTVDGRKLGTTPLERLSLSPGTHITELEHPDFRPVRRKLTIRPGETTKLAIDLRLDGLRR